MELLQKDLEELHSKLQEVIEEYFANSEHDITLEKVKLKTVEKIQNLDPGDLPKTIRFWDCGFNQQNQWECKPSL
jgi:hypothetical protein